eukprot:45063_1
MSRPPNTVEHPSSMNPIWVEQQCMAPTLPDLSPQPRVQQACNPPTFILANRTQSHSTYHAQPHHRHPHHRCTHNNNNNHAHRHPHMHHNQNLYRPQHAPNRSTSTSTPPQPQQMNQMTTPLVTTQSTTNSNPINTKHMPMIRLTGLNQRERIEFKTRSSQVPNPFGPMAAVHSSNNGMTRNMVNVPSSLSVSRNTSKSKSISKSKWRSQCIAMDKADCVEKAASECSAYKACVRPWWIGQYIVVETQSGSQMKGEIKDYCVSTDRVQIWYDNDEMTFEWIELSNLLNWKVSSTRRISSYDTSVPSSVSYKPLPLDLLQRVSVLYRGKEWYTAFIDGFDPISRRHHINYGDTSQWIWTHKKNIKPLPSGVKILKHVEAMRSEIKSKKKYVLPPPFDPIPYELSPKWTAKSIQMCKDKIIKKDLYFYCKGLLRDPNKYLNKKRNKKRKRKREEKSSDDDIVAPTKPPPPKKSKKRIANHKYPRSVVLNGKKWSRAYSKEEKKYFWTNASSNEPSWNPWNDIANINAPWITQKQKYTKFKDDADKPYWYNYENGNSTYKKPLDEEEE